MIKKVTHKIAGWNIEINDKGTKPKLNPNKINYLKKSKQCAFKNCNQNIRINRTSGLCDNHTNHEIDLLLLVKNNKGGIVKAPTHVNIIDNLISWSKTRNYNLYPFFEKISFTILGNVPDVSSLSGDISYVNQTVPSLQSVFQEALNVVYDFFPQNNTSSLQPLKIKGTEIPIIVLATIYVSLIICEEANRGDRWHCRNIRKDESKTSQLGGAMSIAYFAACSFNWGLEKGKSKSYFTK